MSQRTVRPGEEPRAPFEQAIALRYKNPGPFVEEPAANISSGGIFVRTPGPQPIGSVFEFEFRPDADRPPIAGKAQVAWTRRGRRDDGPPGMGARFVELDDDSRHHILELVVRHQRESPPGSEHRVAATDVERTAAAVLPTPATTRPAAIAPRPVLQAPPARPLAVPPPTPTRGTAQASSRLARFKDPRLPWILLSITLAAVLVVVLMRPPAAPPPHAIQAPSPEPASVAPDPAVSGSAALEAAAPATADQVTNAAPTVRADPLHMLDDWARAWSEQRVDDYLASYSARFEPRGGLDRAAWEQQRRSRILAPSWIEISLDDLQLQAVGTGRSRVRFVQAYRSDGYRDTVRKRLDLELGVNGWKIISEIVEP